MPPLRNARQEAFCLALMRGCSGSEAARQAGYAPGRAAATGARLVTFGNVAARLTELRQAAEDATIMTLVERKQRLSEIARANLTDYMELGADGSWVNLGPETPHTGAIAEIHSRTEYDKDGAKPTVHTSVKLHDPIAAMKELNKLEGSYAPTRVDITGEIARLAAQYGLTEAEVMAELQAIIKAAKG